MAKDPLIPHNVLVLTLTPLLAITLIPYYAVTVGFDWYEISIFLAYMGLTGLAITAGYHRLWSHRAYDTHIAIRYFLAFWGACALQNSILKWSADHRRHHTHVDDNDLDPYSAKKGFWFSHIGWILRRNKSGIPNFSNVKDLQRDPVVVWQHKYYYVLTVVTNVGIPLLLGFMHGKLWGVLLLAGLLRLVLNHHFTFFINSLAHIWGSQSYSVENTARDNGFLALFTYGEGYHNYHHRFQYDYRNGIRWWQFDPTKWFVKAGSWIGLTKNLKQPSQIQIEKARLAAQYARALEKTNEMPTAEVWRTKLEEAYRQFLEAIEELNVFQQEWRKARKDALAKHLDKAQMQQRLAELKNNIRKHRESWNALTSQLAVGTA